MADAISGYAVRFGDETVIAGDFRERIAVGAFDKALRANDVVALIGHDTGRVLGRTSAGTLTLRSDRIGLWFSIDIDSTTPEGQTALGTVRRQDMRGMSFAGRFLAEEWQDGGNRLPLRTVTEIDLYEITLTAFPAYTTTSASLRTATPVSTAIRQSQERASAQQRLRGL